MVEGLCDDELRDVVGGEADHLHDLSLGYCSLAPVSDVLVDVSEEAALDLTNDDLDRGAVTAGDP